MRIVCYFTTPDMAVNVITLSTHLAVGGWVCYCESVVPCVVFCVGDCVLGRRFGL